MSAPVARWAAALLLAASAAMATSAAAQRASQLDARCVGGALGCGQLDLRLGMADGDPATLDWFAIHLLDDGWTFADGQPGEAEDALGPNFFAPHVAPGGGTLAGTFDPGFEALLDPTLRLRAQMADQRAPDALPGFAWVAGVGGRATAAGTTGPRRSLLDVRCVDAASCDEVDLTVTLVGGLAATLDHFRVWLPEGSGWRFADGQSGEAEDALGLNFFAPEVLDGGLTLAGTFDAGFEAEVAPTLRLRAQLAAGSVAAGAAPPTLVYELGAGGRVLLAGRSGAAVTAVPEPSAAALVAAGLAGITATAARRRLRRRRPA